MKQKKDRNTQSPDEVRRFAELAKNIPDERQDKIDAIKKRIESGTYNVSAESVAKSIADLHCDLTSGKPCKSQKKTRRSRRPQK